MTKKKILVFLHYYLPGFKSGGPVRTLANMVEQLGDEFEFLIVTSDRDTLDKKPYPNVVGDKWHRLGKAWVYYTSKRNQGFSTWKRLIKETRHDILYLNSLFDPLFTILPLIAYKIGRGYGDKIVIAPRGELFPGALGVKWWKKIPYLYLFRLLGLYSHSVWHASTIEEKRYIQRWFGKSELIIIARNLSVSQVKSNICNCNHKISSDLRIVFLSRICRNKNLSYALKILATISLNIKFDIWGTMGDLDYWEKCQKKINKLPPNINVCYQGVAENSKVIEILSNYDLFFFPTLGENFGHVIAEALTAGIPVLISDRTPWKDLKAKGVGWDLSLDNDNAFVKAIETVAVMDYEKRRKMCLHIQKYSEKKLTDPSIVAANRQMFLQTLNNCS
ncbi:MAG: glycosyltransferase [Desulfobacteraceae bacterium]|jgi:glycosyltransferase involved in cell wall biosynthesis